MKKRNKYIIGAAILSFAVVVGIGATLAHGPRGSWGKPFSCHHGEDMADFIIWKMDRHVKELNLNQAQSQEYEKLKGEVKAGIAEAMERRREFRGMMRSEMEKENPDLNALANRVKERVNNIPDMVSKHIDLFLRFYNMLDEGQKAQVIEMIRWRMDPAQRQLP
jgi:Spy/CpxP family protein refolding chaperone